MTARAAAEWGRRVVAEHRSAGVAAQVVTWGIQVGLPAPLLHMGLRIIRDELDHSALSHEVMVALGGEAGPVDLGAATLLVEPAASPLEGLVREVVRSFCLGESLAVPLFARMRARCDHPIARPALDRILEDEAVHRVFGWEALDALLAMDPQVGPHVEGHLPGWLQGFGGYFLPPEAPPLTSEERGLGLLDHAEYAEIAAGAWREDLVHRFARRGIQAPAA